MKPPMRVESNLSKKEGAEKMKTKLAAMLLAAGATLGAWAVCSHSSTSNVVDKEASCSQSGVYHLVCDYCGETVESGLAIAPLGHDYRLNGHLDPTRRRRR